jgi:tRNA U34 2-thiouridine synthase MnmA/TrmU
MNKKALALLSGGLDSILAIRIMQEQGIEVEAINFLTIFCTCTRKGCQHAATQAANTLKVPLKVFNISEEFLEIVKNPKHGYGSNMNPCIDCRIFIFTKAREYMKECGASFIITGEVLGERPMSQRKEAMYLIEKEAALKRLIVRPLSARLLEPTLPEIEGIVDRERLLEISGRSRKPQITLAKEFGINEYPCPAGGCLLTDPGFANRVRDLMKYGPFDIPNLKLLTVGRHFRLSGKAKLVVGRDEKENAVLEATAKDGDICLKLTEAAGPLSVLRGEADGVLIEKAAAIATYHTKFKDNPSVKVRCWKIGASTPTQTVTSVKPTSPSEIIDIRI